MIDTILTIMAVSGIGAGLAALLVVADRYISNYGECAIDVNDDRTLTVQGGGSLLETLTEEKIFIPSACGGRGSCGYCKVTVAEGAGPILPTEEPYLEADERERGVRLSCQVKVRNDLKISIPEELLSVREFDCVVVEIIDYTYDIKQFRFELKEPAEMSFIPGMYAQVLAPKYKGNPEEVYRAYSISSNPADTGAIELITRLAPNGICTTYLFEHLKVGDPVRINGPYGEFRLSETDAPVIFIAGGSGMAPIKSILHHMEATKCTRPATYFFGVNEPRDLFLVDEMRRFESTVPDFRFVPVMARPEGDWDGETGLVTEAIGRHFDDTSGHEAYLCGSPGMIDASIEVLTGLGMPEGNIYYDKF